MKRTIALLLIGAVMVAAAACAEESDVHEPAARTATPMETLIPQEALDIAMLEEDAAGGESASPESSQSAARTESPLETASARRTESPLQTASERRTESPLETKEESASTEPSAEKVAAAASDGATASPSASASRIGASTSAMASLDQELGLTRQVTLPPGDLAFSVSRTWKTGAIEDSPDAGRRSYDVDSTTQFTLTYQEVGSILGSNTDRNWEILDKLVQAQGLWVGSARMRHVDSAAAYAWNSQFDRSSDDLSDESDVTQIAAFSDGEYLYVAAWLATGNLESSAEQWNAFLGSMELSGKQVWTDIAG